MNKTLILLFTTATLALAVVCIVQWQKRDAQKAELTSLRSEVEQKAREVAELEAAQKLIAKQRHESLEQASDLAGKLQAQRLATAKAAAKAAAASATADGRKSGKGKGGFGDAFAKMFKDPEMMKMIREQQRTMMDSLYSPLVKKLNLTPEEAAQFKDLLADNTMKGTSKATSLLGGDSSTNRTELLNAMSAEQKNFDQQVREFLGESRYAEYKDYQQTVGERMQLNQFRMQNAGSESALTDQQTEQLLAFMREEKQAVAAATGLPLPESGHDAVSLQAMLSDGGTEKLFQAQETTSQRVYERAREILSSEQLGSFGKFQTNQLQMMRMGMNMARKFMASGEPNEGQSPPNQ
jgi:hypothetical protein